MKKTNSQLAALDQEPSHRGAVERLTSEGVGGWCLLAQDPAQSIHLIVSCEGVICGSVLTALPRKDISVTLGSVVNCGFNLRWTECSPDALRALLSALESASADPAGEVCIQVAIEGTDLLLDDDWAHAQGYPSREELMSSLRRLLSATHLSPVAQREALLKREAASLSLSNASETGPRLMAFYLPQFHPIAENDEWWGKGYTEWNNVAVAKPSFIGHDQPRVPADLGYYDLRTPGVIEQQIEMAREYRIHGFCFHYYWFSGTKILDQPLKRFLEIDSDFPFSICWANEPWSRRWDGSESDVLMPQTHTFESDVAFIHDVMPLLLHPRYLRVNGMPILIVYRVNLMADPKRVFDRWRQACIDSGLPGLHISMAETFGQGFPFEVGCDSAVEFPPHRVSAPEVKEPDGLVSEFAGAVFEYGDVVAHEISKLAPPYPRYRTVMLGWDNTSRRGVKGHVFRNYTPMLFERWLEHSVRCARREASPDEQLVFINAWNEWGEGTYLEPDRRHGRANLEAVGRITGNTPSDETRIAALRRSLAGDEEALRDLEALQSKLSALQNSLAYALRTIDLQQVKPTAIGLFREAPLGVDGAVPGGMGYLERIGPTPARPYNVHRVGKWLFLSGWSLAKHQTLAEDSLSYLVLKPLQDPNRPFYALIAQRHAREDVIAATKLDAPHARFSGFSMTTATDEIEPGSYRLSVIFPRRDEQNSTAVELPFNAVLEFVR